MGDAQVEFDKKIETGEIGLGTKVEEVRKLEEQQGIDRREQGHEGKNR